MWQPTSVGSSITAWWDAKVHGRMLPAAPIELAKLLLGASQAGLETFDLAEPAFRLGFGDRMLVVDSSTRHPPVVNVPRPC